MEQTVLLRGGPWSWGWGLAQGGCLITLTGRVGLLLVPVHSVAAIFLRALGKSPRPAVSLGSVGPRLTGTLPGIKWERPPQHFPGGAPSPPEFALRPGPLTPAQ